MSRLELFAAYALQGLVSHHGMDGVKYHDMPAEAYDFAVELESKFLAKEAEDARQKAEDITSIKDALAGYPPAVIPCPECVTEIDIFCGICDGTGTLGGKAPE